MKTHTVEVPDVVVRVLPHVMRLLLYMAGTVAGAYLALVIHQTVPFAICPRDGAARRRERGH